MGCSSEMTGGGNELDGSPPPLAGLNVGRDSNADKICRCFWPCYLCAFADGAIAFIDLDDHWGCRVRRARHELKRRDNDEVADRVMMCRGAVSAYHPGARGRFDGVSRKPRSARDVPDMDFFKWCDISCVHQTSV